jgi:hypothetical protein
MFVHGLPVYPTAYWRNSTTFSAYLQLIDNQARVIVGQAHGSFKMLCLQTAPLYNLSADQAIQAITPRCLSRRAALYSATANFTTQNRLHNAERLGIFIPYAIYYSAVGRAPI